MANQYNIFISHSWAYGDAYDSLVSLLNGRGHFPFNDFSVPRDHPVHNAPDDGSLYAAIKARMSYASVVLMMAGVYATYSRWINYEIRIAKIEFSNPKPILAVKPWAQTRMSSIVQQNADEIVNWNTESVVAAIRRWG